MVLKEMLEMDNELPERFPVVQYLAAFTATLNVICAGMFFGWPSPSLPQLLRSDSPIPITNDEGSWIAVIFLIGAVFGGLMTGIFIDRLGRKNVILLTSLPFFVGWIMVAYAQSLELLLVARFIAGISDGLIFPATCIYLTEISNSRIRGFLGSILTVGHIMGMLSINIIGSYLTIATTALVASVLPVLLLLTFSWMPESPYYLIMKDKQDEARHSLRTFKGTDNVEKELNRLTQAITEQNCNTGRYMDLFTVKSNRKAAFIIMGLRAAQQCSGAMAIAFYAQVIFKETGDHISPIITSTIYFSVQVVVSAFSAIIVDRSGRKPLMIISLSGITIALFIETCCFGMKDVANVESSSITITSIAALILYVMMFAVGMQTIPLIVVGEVFPTNVKAFAVCCFDIYFCVITTIVAKFFQLTKDMYGLYVPFIVFTIFGFLGLLFIIFCVPETKGKTLEEIQEALKGESRSINRNYES